MSLQNACLYQLNKVDKTYLAKLKAHLRSQFIMSSIKVIACKRVLGSRILSLQNVCLYQLNKVDKDILY